MDSLHNTAGFLTGAVWIPYRLSIYNYIRQGITPPYIVHIYKTYWRKSRHRLLGGSAPWRLAAYGRPVAAMRPLPTRQTPIR